mmetsp:Transcript_77977/g.226211  ORF Transcript_77977/g.226211 Transcript_77977/m.226211 type:complete len:275 (-) Transcript_77977:57-881(-)
MAEPPIGEALRQDDGLVPLMRARPRSAVDIDLVARIQHEGVALVHGVPCERRLELHHALGGLPHLEQPRLVGAEHDVVEAGVHAAGEVCQLREQSLKLLRLLALHLAVLCGLAAQEVVELHRLVRRCADLVGGALTAQPEEDCVAQRLPNPLHLQDDVRVPGVEAAVARRRPRNDLKFLDAPDGQPGLVSDALPSVLRLGCGQSQRDVLLVPDAREVRLLPRYAVRVPRFFLELRRHAAVLVGAATLPEGCGAAKDEGRQDTTRCGATGSRDHV